MRAGELCVRDVVTAFADESVIDVARRMAEFGVGDVVVVIAQRPSLPRPIGIVTDRDLVVHVLARTDRRPAEVKVADVMRRELVVAREDDDIESVVAKMRAQAIRRIPIVDERGGLQGMLSLDDVLGWMRDQIEATTKTVERQGHGPLQRHPVP